MSLRVEGLGVIRGGRPVFGRLSFHLRPGELLTLRGANGSGKSTLLRSLCGLLQAAEGEVFWKEESVLQNLPAFHANLHYLGHLDPVKPLLTLRENLSFWAGLRGVLGGKIEEALERVGLAALADQPANILSAGQRRRLALSLIVAVPAELWLLDEPTVGLDSASVRLLAEEIEAHLARGGICLAATHLDLGLTACQSLDMADFAVQFDPQQEYLW